MIHFMPKENWRQSWSKDHGCRTCISALRTTPIFEACASTLSWLAVHASWSDRQCLEWMRSTSRQEIHPAPTELALVKIIYWGLNNKSVLCLHKYEIVICIHGLHNDYLHMAVARTNIIQHHLIAKNHLRKSPPCPHLLPYLRSWGSKPTVHSSWRSPRDLIPFMPESQYVVPNRDNALHASEGHRWG